MSADRPWWASEGDRLAPEEDPLDRHLGARRPTSRPEGQGPARGPGDPTGTGEATAEGPGAARTGEGAPSSWWVAAVDAATRLVREAAGDHPASTPRPGDPPTAEHRIDACGICPVCVGLRALGEARPELVGHLAEAARHLALAVRAAVDGATDAGEPAAPTDGTRDRPGSDRLRRIDLDD